MTDQDLKKIRTIVKEEAGSAELRIVGEIGKFLEDHLLPILDQKADKTDIDRIERKLDRVLAKDLEIELNLYPL